METEEIVTATSPTIETENWSHSMSVLRCPGCREEMSYLHSTTVTVFTRAEDDRLTELTSVSRTPHGARIRKDTAESATCDNPSSRRHGITIQFHCELCKAQPQLRIAQHKGHTEIGWRYTVTDDEIL